MRYLWFRALSGLDCENFYKKNKIKKEKKEKN
jgi:hypothetical protein